MVRLHSLAIAALVSASTAIVESSFAAKDIITRDVAIIGGGASGTYAAVRLREDFHTSVVVIEEQDHLVRSPSRKVFQDDQRPCLLVRSREGMLTLTSTRYRTYTSTMV